MMIRLVLLVFLFGCKTWAVAEDCGKSIHQLTEKMIKLRSKAGKDPYAESYERAFPSGGRESSLAEIFESSKKTKVTFVSDEHGAKEPNDFFINLIDQHDKKNITLVIEFIESYYQKQLDEYLAGGMTLADLRRASKFDAQQYAWDWKEVTRIIVKAKAEKIPVLAAQQRQLGAEQRMYLRDKIAAGIIRQHRKKHPKTKYLVLFGGLHMAGKKHLPDQLGEKSKTVILSWFSAKAANINKKLLKCPLPVIRFSEGVYFKAYKDPRILLQEEIRFLESIKNHSASE